MKRVLILGNSGTGKSTLAVRLGLETGLPVVHLDAHFWLAGWIKPNRDEWQEEVNELLSGETWIMDGNFRRTLSLRLNRTDTVIYLDFPRRICLLRIFKRLLSYWGKTRPDLAPGCKEKIDWSFIKWVWNFPRDVRGKVFDDISAHQQKLNLIVLYNNRHVEEFFNNLQSDDNK